MRIVMLLASMAALMASAPVPANDWRPLTVQSDGTKVGILPSSIRREGDTISAVLSFAPKGGPEWASMVSVNCLRHTIFSARLPAPGEGPVTIRPATGAYRPIRDGSVGAAMANAVCTSTLPPDISIDAVGGGQTMNQRVRER